MAQCQKITRVEEKCLSSKNRCTRRKSNSDKSPSMARTKDLTTLISIPLQSNMQEMRECLTQDKKRIRRRQSLSLGRGKASQTKRRLFSTLRTMNRCSRRPLTTPQMTAQKQSILISKQCLSRVPRLKPNSKPRRRRGEKRETWKKRESAWTLMPLKLQIWGTRKRKTISVKKRWS